MSYKINKSLAAQKIKLTNRLKRRKIEDFVLQDKACPLLVVKTLEIVKFKLTKFLSPPCHYHIITESDQ